MKSWDLPRWLLFLICFGALPHVTRIPVWNSAISASFLLWFYLHLKGYVAKPNKALRISFAFLSLGGILYTYRTVFGLDAGLAFIVQISCLKLFELEEMRDSILIIWLTSILIIGEILYEQNILVTAWFLVGIGFIAHVMGKVYHWEKAPLAHRKEAPVWRFSARAAAQVLPLAIILFIVFPRLNFTLWGAFSAGMSGVIGFSDELRPGEVASLATNNRVAFRARILTGERPPIRDLYWRGVVLSTTDGLSWLRARDDMQEFIENEPILDPNTSNKVLVQEITLEPHQRNWLFAMDTPSWIQVRGGFTTGVRQSSGNIFTSTRRIQSRVSYSVHSDIYPSGLESESLTPSERKRNLQVPRNYRSPLRKLANDIRSESRNDQEYVEGIMNYFATNGFEYTLAPGRLQGQDIAEFVLETKKGFCEHFAGAAAFLLRLGGVPARVVAGFHGGKMNPYGDYLLVGYQDAHAWVEAWIEGSGWTRVDPTGVVAPGRLILGGQDFMDRFGIDASVARNTASLANTEAWTLARLVSEVIFFWDSVNDRWNQLLISYDRDFQREMLTNVGWRYPIWIKLTILGALGLGLVLLFLSLYFRYRTSTNDKVLLIYNRLLRALASRGIHRRDTEGPIDLLLRARNNDRLRSLLPVLESAIATYIKLRFGPSEVTKKDLQNFENQVRKLA